MTGDNITADRERSLLELAQEQEKDWSSRRLMEDTPGWKTPGWQFELLMFLMNPLSHDLTRLWALSTGNEFHLDKITASDLNLYNTALASLVNGDEEAWYQLLTELPSGFSSWNNLRDMGCSPYRNEFWIFFNVNSQNASGHSAFNPLAGEWYHLMFFLVTAAGFEPDNGNRFLLRFPKDYYLPIGKGLASPSGAVVKVHQLKPAY